MMKQELETLYKSNIDRIKAVRDAFPETDLEGPFLISALDEYQHAAKRIMIIGQQTKGWYCDVEDVDAHMKGYEEFNFGENYYNTPFWSFFHKIGSALLDRGYRSVWANINRFDLEADRPTGEVEEKMYELDFLLVKEIEILKPDSCIFLTGPSFDERLRSIFPGIEFDSVRDWDTRKFCRLSHSSLPQKTYRTYHPNYLRRSKLEATVLTDLIDAIS